MPRIHILGASGSGTTTLGAAGRSAKASTSFFEKKEAKKFLIPLVRTGETTGNQIKKSFLFLFLKKKRFP